MSRWFRFHVEAMRNPKVAQLSDREFRLWIKLLCVAAENDGAIPSVEALKGVLNARLDHLLAGVERQLIIGLIDRKEQGYEPHHWSKFQYKSDTSTGRVQKHRTKRNVSETAPETETDTETDNTPRGVLVDATPTRDALRKEFDQVVWGEFPQNPESDKAAAFALYTALSPADRIGCIRGVARVSIRFEDAKSDEPLDRRLKYFPHLTTWIRNRGWEQELAAA